MRYLFILFLLAPCLSLAQSTQPASQPSWIKQLQTCGDGVVNPGEACDDGNNRDHDGCFQCKVVPRSDVYYAPAPKLDPNRAFQLSITMTMFGPPGLGLIYGPSMGHFYAGEYGHAIATSLVRAALVGADIAVGVETANGDIEARSAQALFIGDGLVLMAFVVGDLLDGPRAVMRANGTSPVSAATPSKADLRKTKRAVGF